MRDRLLAGSPPAGSALTNSGCLGSETSTPMRPIIPAATQAWSAVSSTDPTTPGNTTLPISIGLEGSVRSTSTSTRPRPRAARLPSMSTASDGPSGSSPTGRRQSAAPSGPARITVCGQQQHRHDGAGSVHQFFPLHGGDTIILPAPKPPRWSASSAQWRRSRVVSFAARAARTRACPPPRREPARRVPRRRKGALGGVQQQQTGVAVGNQ